MCRTKYVFLFSVLAKLTFNNQDLYTGCGITSDNFIETCINSIHINVRLILSPFFLFFKAFCIINMLFIAIFEWIIVKKLNFKKAPQTSKMWRLWNPCAIWRILPRVLGGRTNWRKMMKMRIWQKSIITCNSQTKGDRAILRPFLEWTKSQETYAEFEKYLRTKSKSAFWGFEELFHNVLCSLLLVQKRLFEYYFWCNFFWKIKRML